jgi:hypothetical protein
MMRTVAVWIGAGLMAGGLWNASVISQGLADEPAAPSRSSEATEGTAGNETGGADAGPPMGEGAPGPSPEAGEVPEQTVSLTQAVHFTDATSQNVVVGPGSYRVDAEGTNRISLLPSETGEAVVIDAVSFTHQEAVERPVPVTVSDPEQPDVLHVVLVLPNGQALAATGSLSGTRSRVVSPRMFSPRQFHAAVLAQAPSARDHRRPSGGTLPSGGTSLTPKLAVVPGLTATMAPPDRPSVVIYEHPNFGGRSQTLGVGGYTFSDFNEIASSIRVPAGLVALLYEHVDAGGGYGLSIDLLEDRPDLSQVNFNDKLSYVCVFSSPTPQGFIWARASIQNGQFVAGHWERQRASGTPVNTTAVVAPPLSPHPANAPPASCDGGSIVRDHRPGPIFRSATVLLPRHQNPISVMYEVRAGNALFQEDIDLGPESQLGLLGQQGSVSWNVSGSLGVVQQPLSVMVGRDSLWPGGVVPFEIDLNSISMTDPLRTVIQQGITNWNSTTVRFEPRNGERDHVVFVRDTGISPAAGSSRLGRQGGRQEIKLNSTARDSTVIHEMGHAVGVFHEQSRMDRDSYVEILWDNIENGLKHNFSTHVEDGIDLGPYDMTSRMHYHGTAFGKTDPQTGQVMTTIRSRIPGQAISPSRVLSANDIAGINQLYPPVNCGRIPVLYQDVNSGGQALPLEFSQPNLGSNDFGDEGSSLCVPMGWTVTLYADSDYRGENVIIQGPAMFQDLHRNGPNGINWGDRVDAVRLEGAQANPPPPGCTNTVILFEHDHYVGRRLALTNNIATLHTWSFGDNVSSVCVPTGWTVRLYKDTSYRGDSVVVVGPMVLPDLHREGPGGRNWGDMFSSAAVTGPANQANQPPPACINNPILFEHDNYRGRPFDLLSDVPDLKLNQVTPFPIGSFRNVVTYPNSFNDKASSLCVPAGWTITLYQDPNYTGQSVQIAPSQNWGDLHRNGPLGQNWGDKVSSVRVSRIP